MVLKPGPPEVPDVDGLPTARGGDPDGIPELNPPPLAGPDGMPDANPDAGGPEGPEGMPVLKSGELDALEGWFGRGGRPFGEGVDAILCILVG